MTDQTMRAPGARQFTIGNAISASLEVFGRHLVAFSVIPAIMLVPLFVLAIVVFLIIGVGAAGGGSLANAHGGLVVAFIPIFLVYFACVIMSVAAIAYGTIQDMRGQRVGMGACLARAFSSLIPLVLAAFAVGILCMLGFILLVIPGLMIWTALSIVAPAIVVEKLGVGDGLRRSRELTKGRRWSVYGAFFLTAVCLGVLNYLVSNIIGPMLGAVVGGILSLVITFLIQGFQAVLVAVIYFQLRVEKEGVTIDDIAKVFD